MKIFLLSLYFFFVQDEVQLTEIRKLFHQAEKSRGVSMELKDKLKHVDKNQPLLLGYKAMAEMLLAKHDFNPINKIRFFNKGRELLNQAIVESTEAENIELRYLRFTVQTNAPSFLGYKGNVHDDKMKVIKYLVKSNNKGDLDSQMRAFMLQSPHVSEEEKKMLSN